MTGYGNHGDGTKACLTLNLLAEDTNLLAGEYEAAKLLGTYTTHVEQLLLHLLGAGVENL